ncbi:outer membrane beta-barrel protein [Sphingomonas sp. PL-96]|uniref:outer membrane beta-barrel protein n=1 Tax=Sphingomonas sp. PL-96 TaxID=2887201 RepID=UPI001E503E89|nr:outer membrane beta-barrel protein [Sphingomonas sp. PL-96]MCC2975162.1 outer membrane beta-barrel protein [Sphingomonas sp. PL-96]
MRARRGAAALLCVAAWPGLAGAQALQDRPFEDRQQDPDLSVVERRHPELDPLGIPLGSFLVEPSIDLGTQYDSNIYALDQDPIDDLIVTAGANLAIRSDWSRNALNASASVSSRQYLQAERESTTDYQLAAGGRLDLERGYLDLSLETAKLTQSRRDVDAPGAADRPIRFHSTGGTLVGEYPFGQVTARAGLDWHRYRFNDAQAISGAPLPQDFRDRDVFSTLARVDYAVSPALALYVDATANRRSYRRLGPAGFDRDSWGFTVEGGADFDITRQVRGHFQAGYLSQEGPNRSWWAKGLSGRGRIEWFAKPVLTITVEGGRRIEDAAQADTPAYLSTDIIARADYELLRSLIVSAEAGYTWDTFQGTGGRAERPQWAGGARYRMGRGAVYELRYEHLGQDSSAASGLRNFRDDRILLTVRFQR